MTGPINDLRVKEWPVDLNRIDETREKENVKIYSKLNIGSIRIVCIYLSMDFTAVIFVKKKLKKKKKIRQIISFSPSFFREMNQWDSRTERYFHKFFA